MAYFIVGAGYNIDKYSKIIVNKLKKKKDLKVKEISFIQSIEKPDHLIKIDIALEKYKINEFCNN